MTDVADRVSALEAALATGEPWLAPALVEQARETVDRSVKRVELGADHTVVALVGATGSGKSSLFNALARMDIAQVGARRPMTSMPMACVWGEGGSEELLDWLQVPESRRITRESVLDADLQAPLQGLVLLDLPDHDSTEVVHRVEVDRLVTMVDLLVWVVDPQKYADDALHSGYLQRLVGHDAVMVVVLNQIDRLDPEEAQTCTRDLRRLLDGDGLGRVRMLPVSARRGDGVDDLRGILAGVVQDRSAVEERVGADLQLAIDALATGLAAEEPGDSEPPAADVLVAELAAAAGVPVVLDALASEYRRRGRTRTGWPVLRALQRVAPGRSARPGTPVNEHDVKLIAGGQWPGSATSQRPRVELAVEAVVAASADPLPQRWADAVREGVSSEDDLVVELDRRLAAVDLRLTTPTWWWPVAIVQYLLAAAVAVGAVWSLLLGIGRIVGQDVPAREVAGVPLPVLLLVVGLVAGALLAALSAWALAVGARRRRQAAQDRLAAAVQSIAGERVIDPIRVVLKQHRATRLALAGRALPALREARPGATEVGDATGSTALDGAHQPAGAPGLDGAAESDGAGGLDGAQALNGAGALDGAQALDGAGGLDAARGLGGARGLDGAGGLDGARGSGAARGMDGAGERAAALKSSRSRSGAGPIGGAEAVRAVDAGGGPDAVGRADAGGRADGVGSADAGRSDAGQADPEGAGASLSASGAAPAPLTEPATTLGPDESASGSRPLTV